MTEFEWAMVSITAAGFLLTAGGVLGGAVWAVARINRETTDKINEIELRTSKSLSEAVEARNREIESLRVNFGENQLTQDRNFGEGLNALRAFIQGVEKEVHRAERDALQRFVQKSDFERAVDALTGEMRAGFASVKGDIVALKKDLKEDIKSDRG